MHSGTPTTITYYLTKNPAAQSKLQAVLDEVLGHEDDPMDPGQPSKLSPTSMPSPMKASHYSVPFP